MTASSVIKESMLQGRVLWIPARVFHAQEGNTTLLQVVQIVPCVSKERIGQVQD